MERVERAVGGGLSPSLAGSLVESLMTAAERELHAPPILFLSALCGSAAQERVLVTYEWELNENFVRVSFPFLRDRRPDFYLLCLAYKLNPPEDISSELLKRIRQFPLLKYIYDYNPPSAITFTIFKKE